LGEVQNKLASGNSNTPHSADSGNVIVRVITTHQQAASASSVDNNTLPSTNGVHVSSNAACHDSTSVVSQTSNSVYIQPWKMELTQGSETSANYNYNMTPGKYPKEHIQYYKHGESLKSTIAIQEFAQM
jgi:hypothetical protein